MNGTTGNQPGVARHQFRAFTFHIKFENTADKVAHGFVVTSMFGAVVATVFLPTTHRDMFARGEVFLPHFAGFGCRFRNDLWNIHDGLLMVGWMYVWALKQALLGRFCLCPKQVRNRFTRVSRYELAKGVPQRRDRHASCDDGVLTERITKVVPIPKRETKEMTRCVQLS